MAAVPVLPSLVNAKLKRPSAPRHLVSRPRLVARLNAGLQSGHAVTLISAPAGYGKTTLAVEWLAQLARPAAWLSLDPADDDPLRFFTYFLSALRQVDGALGTALLSTFQAGHLPPQDVLVSSLTNSLAAARLAPVCVLDDFQLIQDPVILAVLQGLLAYQPAGVHLVLVTREDPPLPLGRLRARGQMTEVRAADLRLAGDEIQRFLLQSAGVALSTKDAADLAERTEGWIAGLQLAGLSMQGHADPSAFIRGLSGSHRFILSYLTEEVLATQPAEVQDFLLQTSILDQLCGDLCDAVTGRTDSTVLLERLWSSNLFLVPLDDEARWYRYHHLFADLLGSQLRRKLPGAAPGLHSRASAWYEQHGMAAEAIEHALAAQDHPRAHALIETHARAVVLAGHARAVEGWLHRLPGAQRVASPRANLAFAWSLLLRGQLGEIEVYLHNAEAGASQASSGSQPSEGTALQAEALALRSVLTALRGDGPEACKQAARAVALAPADDLYTLGMVRFCLAAAHNYAGHLLEAIAAYRDALPVCRASGNAMATMLAVANLTVLYHTSGQLRAAAQFCREAIAAAEQSADPYSPSLATVIGGYSEVFYARGKLNEAQALADRALALSRSGGHVAAISYMSVVLSRLRQSQNNLSGAEQALVPALPLLQQGMPAWVSQHVVAQQVSLALSHGDTAGAAHILAQTGISSDDPSDHRTEVIQIAYLRLLLHLGRAAPDTPHLSQALKLADRLLVAAETAGRMGHVLELLVLRSLVHAARGETPAALADLARALDLAEPEGYVQVFVNEGEAMRALIAQFARSTRTAADPGAQRRVAYAHTLLDARSPVTDHSAGVPLAAPERTPQSAVAPLVEPLTDRELEVLRLIADGLTYGEVAQTLIVSLNTVRFHVKSIYGKLGVNRQAHAVSRARELRLL